MSFLAFMISVKVMWAKVIFTSNIFGLIKKNCQRTQCDSKNDTLFNNINVTCIIKTDMWPLRLALHCKHLLSCVTVTCIVWYVFVHRWGGPPSQPSRTVGFSAVQRFLPIKKIGKAPGSNLRGKETTGLSTEIRWQMLPSHQNAALSACVP